MPSPERESWARLINTVERKGDITAGAAAVLRRRDSVTLGLELANVEAVLRQATIAGRDLGARPRERIMRSAMAEHLTRCAAEQVPATRARGRRWLVPSLLGLAGAAVAVLLLLDAWLSDGARDREDKSDDVPVSDRAWPDGDATLLIRLRAASQCRRSSARARSTQSPRAIG